MSKPWLIALAVGGLATSGCASQRSTPPAEVPNFAGTWRLDPDATEPAGGGRGDARGVASGGGGGAGGGAGLGPPAEELIILQTDTTLTVREQRNTDMVQVVYRLDGKRTQNSMPIGSGSTATAAYSTRWNGATLATSISRTMAGRGPGTSVQYREERYLTPDGKMVVKTTIM